MLLKLCLSLSLIIGLYSCSHTDQKAVHPDDSFGITKFTLENGLRLLVIPNHNLPIFSYYTFFDVGGRYEEKGTTGATHFLEHMMFKGAKKYGPSQFDSTIESNGGSNNAYTTFDSTVYYESAPSRMFEKIADMEADRMQFLLLEKNSFEKERGVVLEERKLRYENSPNGLLYLKMMKEVFKGTPYGGSVIGDAADVQNLKRDQMMKFFKKFYTPDNAIIVLSGDITASKAYDVINEKFGKIKSSTGLKEFKMKMDAPARYSHRAKYKRSIKIHGNSKTPIFMMSFKGEKLGTHESYVMDLLASILGDGASSYLTQKYVQNKKPILTSIYASNYTLKHNGVFFIGGELLQTTKLSKIKKSLSRDLSKFCKKSIDERSLQKVKNNYLVGFYKGSQTNAGVARMIGSYESFFGDYMFYKKELAIYQSITLDEVKASCKRVFNSKESIFLSVWDKHKK